MPQDNIGQVVTVYVLLPLHTSHGIIFSTFLSIHWRSWTPQHGGTVQFAWLCCTVEDRRNKGFSRIWRCTTNAALRHSQRTHIAQRLLGQLAFSGQHDSFLRLYLWPPTYSFSVSIFVLFSFRVDGDVLCAITIATRKRAKRVDRTAMEDIYAYKQMVSQATGGNLVFSSSVRSSEAAVHAEICGNPHWVTLFNLKER